MVERTPSSYRTYASDSAKKNSLDRVHQCNETDVRLVDRCLCQISKEGGDKFGASRHGLTLYGQQVVEGST
jgi:hypothetical protein